MGRQRPAQYAGGDDVRTRHGRYRGRSDAYRGAGFSGKADLAAKIAVDRGARAAPSGNADRVVADACRVRSLRRAARFETTAGAGRPRRLAAAAARGTARADRGRGT